MGIIYTASLSAKNYGGFQSSACRVKDRRGRQLKRPCDTVPASRAAAASKWAWMGRTASGRISRRRRGQVHSRACADSSTASENAALPSSRLWGHMIAVPIGRHAGGTAGRAGPVRGSAGYGTAGTAVAGRGDLCEGPARKPGRTGCRRRRGPVCAAPLTVARPRPPHPSPPPQALPAAKRRRQAPPPAPLSPPLHPPPPRSKGS